MDGGGELVVGAEDGDSRSGVGHDRAELEGEVGGGPVKLARRIIGQAKEMLVPKGKGVQWRKSYRPFAKLNGTLGLAGICEGRDRPDKGLGIVGAQFARSIEIWVRLARVCDVKKRSAKRTISISSMPRSRRIAVKSKPGSLEPGETRS